jgi:hypothetical protein
MLIGGFYMVGIIVEDSEISTQITGTDIFQFKSLVSIPVHNLQYQLELGVWDRHRLSICHWGKPFKLPLPVATL